MGAMHLTVATVPALADLCAVLFDMDGTLVNSNAVVERTWGDWAGENGVDAAAVLASCHGSPAELTVRRHRPDLDDATVAEHVARLADRECHDLAGIVPCEGALEAVEAVVASRRHWAVVTSASRPLARARLEAAGFAEPPQLVTVEDVIHGKPDPEPFLVGARWLGVAIGDCLVVEDSPPGLESGRRSGAHVLAVGPDAVSLRDLTRHWGG